MKEIWLIINTKARFNMFKEFVMWGQQAQTDERRQMMGVDLTTVNSYIRRQADSYARLMGKNLSVEVYMNDGQWADFLVNLKTANRLKKMFE